jgi:hypothetical protein
VNQQDKRARYAVGIYNPELLGKGLGTEITKGEYVQLHGATGTSNVKQ